MTTLSTGQPITATSSTTDTADDTVNNTTMPRSAEVPPPRKRGRTSSQVDYLHKDNSNSKGLLFATTPTSAGSTSSCSDRDSSPDILAFRSSIMPPARGRVSTAALASESRADKRESGGAAAEAAGLKAEENGNRNPAPHGEGDFGQTSEGSIEYGHEAHGRCSSSSSYESGTDGEGEQIGAARLTRCVWRGVLLVIWFCTVQMEFGYFQ